jgi:hypothetical protein
MNGLSRRAFMALAGSALLVPKTTIFLPPSGGWPVFNDQLGLAIAQYMATLWTPQDFADLKKQLPQDFMRAEWRYKRESRPAGSTQVWELIEP